jgi:peptidoglycan/LPS O-acetylase OafA/YrhL
VRRSATVTTATRLTELDSLRGIAAIGVVLFHLTYWYDAFGASPIHVSWGHYGVELFFVISGYVIFMTLDRTQFLAEFAVSRIARLMPAYWTGVLLTSLVANLVPLAWDRSPPGAALVAINLSMLQRFLMIPDIDNSYWTLAIELSFYVMMGLAYRAGLLRQIDRLCLIWLACAAAARTILLLCGETRNLGPISSLTGLFYGQFFILGIVAYRLRQGRGSRLTLAVAIGACAMSLFGGGPYSLHARPPEYFAATLAVAALVWVAVANHARWLRWAPLVLLGQMS